MRAPAAHTRLAGALVGLVILLVFVPALRNDFVNWDDEQNFTLNSRYRGLAPANLYWMATTFHKGPYQPLSWFTLGLDYTLWGMNPVGYHLTNVLLHAVSGVLLFALILQLLRQGQPAGPSVAAGPGFVLAAAAGALLWAVHPLRVESVAWVTERRDVLSGCLVLLALLAYVERPAGPRPLVVALAGLALLAKASAMVLPAWLLVLDVYPLQRLGGRTGWTSSAARRVWLEKLPFFALSVAAAIVALAGQRRVGALVSLAAIPPGARAGAAMYHAGFQLWKTVLPVRLLPLYEYPAGMGMLHPLALAGAATLVVLAAAAWTVRKRCPGLGAGVAAYVIALAPTSGLAQSGVQVAADRYTYLPLLPWSVLAAAALTRVWTRDAPPIRRIVVVAVAGGALLVLAALTVRQTGFWRNSTALWERALALEPRSALVHHWLGRAYMADGRIDEVIQLYEGWLRDDPENAEGWGDYGAMLVNVGAFDRALPVLEKAIALEDSNATAHYARARVRDRNGDSAGALADYTESLRLDPALGVAYYNRGLIRRKSGDVPGALDDFARALTFEEVRSAENAFVVYANYGLTLADDGQIDAGLRALEVSTLLAPPESRPQFEALRRQVEARKRAG